MNLPRGGIARRDLLRAGGAAIAGLAVAAACGSDRPATAWQRVLQAGRIRVAIADEVPYGFIGSDGQLTGAFPEMIRAVAGTVGIQRLDGVVVPFGSLIDTLVADRADIIGAGMTVTADRCARLVFGRPDLRAMTGLAVRAGNPLGLSDYTSIVTTGATIGVLRGAVEERDVHAIGVTDERVVTFDDVEAMVPALASGTVDAVALTARAVRALVAQAAADSIVALAAFVPTINGKPVERLAALAFPRDDRTIVDGFEAAAEPLRRDGTISAIFRRYGWSAEDLPAPGQSLACG